jgi:hypothetical protein
LFYKNNAFEITFYDKRQNLLLIVSEL